MTELSWKHHAIIQALLSRGPLKEKDFYSMFNGLTGKNPGTDQHALQQYLLKINKALSFVHLEMRRCMDQYDGQVYYGVVNTVSDEQSKLGTMYTVPQIAFYKAVGKFDAGSECSRNRNMASSCALSRRESGGKCS